MQPMDPRRGDTVDKDDHLSESRVSRRIALQTLVTTVGVGVAAPLAAAEATQHLHDAAEAPNAQGTGAAAASTRVFLSNHQFETLNVLANLILPGSLASGTPAFIDRLLAVEDVDTRRRFVSALGAFDGEAMRAHSRAFKDVTAAEQTALLTQASTMAPSRPPVAWRRGDPIGAPAAAAEPGNLRDYFDHIKGIVADIHFSSEPGLRELGWTGSIMHTRFNGCATQP